MPPKTLAPKQALQAWAKKREIYPALFARDLACTDAHAWELLRGKREISLNTLGKLLVVYGIDGPAPAIAVAMKVAGLVKHGQVALPTASNMTDGDFDQPPEAETTAARPENCVPAQVADE